MNTTEQHPLVPSRTRTPLRVLHAQFSTTYSGSLYEDDWNPGPIHEPALLRVAGTVPVDERAESLSVGGFLPPGISVGVVYLENDSVSTEFGT